MRKIPWFLLAIFLVLAIWLIGCGASEKDKGAGGKEGSSPAPAAKNAETKAKPATVAEIALYDGADRQQVLLEGAKKEGKISLYTSAILTQSVEPMVKAFEAKYPFLKVEIFRASNDEIVARTLPEYQKKVYNVDVFETTTAGMVSLKEAKILQTYNTPEAKAYPPEASDKDKMYFPTRESYVGLGYNTKLIAKEEVPKTYNDLLDPKWKGKMAIAGGGSTAQRWVGAVYTRFGEEMLQKLSKQDIQMQNVSGRALADLVVSGEVPLSPTIYDSHIANSQSKGAPVDWYPIEPVVTNVGQAALAVKAQHPYASMLFIDFLLSEEGQKIYFGTGYGSARKGIGGTSEYKKIYMEEGKTASEYQEVFKQWEDLTTKYFMK